MNLVLRFFVLLSLVAAAAPVFAQTAFTLYGGYRYADLRYADLTFRYDNPYLATPYIHKKSLNEARYGLALGMGFEGYAPNQFFGAGRFETQFLWQIFGMGFEGGAGYGIQIGDMMLRPEVDLAFYWNWVQLGHIPNNGPGLQVNNTFFAPIYDVKTNLRTFDMGFKPRLSLDYPLSDGVRLRVTGGYFWAFLTDSRIRFKSANWTTWFGKSHVSTTRRLDAYDVSFLVDGQRRTTAPHSLASVFVNVEFVFILGD